jgi:hypothetical protein
MALRRTHAIIDVKALTIEAGISMAANEITLSMGISPAQPLWKLAPTRDEHGKHLGDFLMIIPRLSKKPERYIKQTLSDLEKTLKQFSDSVVFANLDMKLNTLWVSFKNEPGLFMEIIAAVKHSVPEALLVGDMGSRLYKK